MSDAARSPILSTTTTGELFLPSRIIYRVHDREGLLRGLRRLRCMGFDEARRRWTWNYEFEAEKMGFPTAYDAVPPERVLERRLKWESGRLPEPAALAEVLARPWGADPADDPCGDFDGAPDAPGALEWLGQRHAGASGAPRLQKIGRNEPCPCGSGKKFKKCCLDHPLGHA